MNQKVIGVLIALFVVIVAGMFAFAYMKRADIQADAGADANDQTDEETPYDYITRIDAKHFYIDGTHTIAGEVLMPTPCDLLEYDARVAESDPEQVTVAFDVINNAETCAAVVTPQRFMVSFDASEDASVGATFMGRPVTLNLVPAAEGETPEDFELYIKG